jgi:hypothetical protein
MADEGIIVGQLIIHKLILSPTVLGIRARNEDLFFAGLGSGP